MAPTAIVTQNDHPPSNGFSNAAATTDGRDQLPGPPPEPDPAEDEMALFEKQNKVPTKWKEPNSARWKKIRKDVAEKSDGFKASEVYSEGDHSMHNQVKSMLAQRARWEGRDTATISNELPLIKDLAAFFQTVMDGRTTNFGSEKVSTDDPARVKIKQLIADLAQTEPKACFKGDLQDGDKTLTRNQMTIAWSAAVSYLGSQYPEELMPPEVDSDDDMETTEEYDLTTFANKRKGVLKQTSMTAHTASHTNSTGSPLKKKSKTVTISSTVPMPDTDTIAEERRKGWSVSGAEKLTNISGPRRRYRERFNMRFLIPKGSMTPRHDFKKRFKLWYDRARAMDKTLVINPWYKRHKKQGSIVTANDIPKDWDEFRIFVGRADPKSTDDKVYCRISMASNLDMRVFTHRRSEMEGAYGEGEFASIADLRDAETTTEIGFLAYSGNFTNAKQTVRYINQMLRERNLGVQVGGKVRLMGKVTDAQRALHQKHGGRWINVPWAALHLHAELKHARRATKALGRLFNAKNADRGGLNYRYVPNPGTTILGAKTATKIRAMVRKHISYVRSLRGFTLEGDFTLDEADSNTKQITLRQFLSTQTTEQGNPYIHDVNTTHMADGQNDAIHVVAFDERYDKATGIINSIAIRCKEEINDSTLDWFSEDVVEISSGMVRTPEGDYVDKDTEDTLDYIVDEDMGNLVIEGLSDLILEEKPKRKNLEDASFFSFGTAIGRSMTSTNYSIPESEATTQGSQSEPAEEQANEVEKSIQAARANQQAEQDRATVQEQSQRIAELDRIIAELQSNKEKGKASHAPASSTSRDDTKD